MKNMNETIRDLVISISINRVVANDLNGNLVEVINTFQDFRVLVHRHDPTALKGVFAKDGLLMNAIDHTSDINTIALANRISKSLVIYHDSDGTHWHSDLDMGGAR
jgi:hypothetical protein